MLVGEHPRSAEYLLDPEQVPQLSLVFALLDLDAHFLVVLEALHVIFEQRELVHLPETTLRRRSFRDAHLQRGGSLPARKPGIFRLSLRKPLEVARRTPDSLSFLRGSTM